MLPKINRLVKKTDFDTVFKKGKSLKSDFLICKIFKNTSHAIRIGFVVSKKVSNKATVRNRVKRKLRAAALSQLQQSGLSQDMVIVALPGAQKMAFIETKKAMEVFFKK